MQINPVNNSNNKYNLNENPLDIMPQHLISKVTSFLDKNSIQNIALLNKSICKSVKAAANFNESNLIKNFIQTLIQKLNVGIYPEQREQLVGIEQNIVPQKFANLRLQKEYILNVKAQLIGAIKTLDEETTNDLMNHVQPPNFFENILELVALERRIDAANLGVKRMTPYSGYFNTKNSSKFLSYFFYLGCNTCYDFFDLPSLALDALPDFGC